MKISWSFNLTGEFTIFYLFIFSEDLHMCSPYQYRQMCGKIFFVVLQLEDLKKKKKILVSTCFEKPGFPILHYNRRTKQNKNILRHCNHYKRIHVQNCREK